MFPYVSVSDQLLFVVKNALMSPYFTYFCLCLSADSSHFILFVSCSLFKCQASAGALQCFG